MFTVRRMIPSDKPALLDVSSRIWEGGDYIPAVFDEWVADREGEFAALLLDGKVVGCGKLTFFTPTDAWLEGLRKDPLVKEKGAGQAMARYFLGRLAARCDLTSLRFSTYMKNVESITVNERLGFRRRTVLSCKAWEGTPEQLAAMPLGGPEPRQKSSGVVATAEDEAQVLDFIDRRGYFAATDGLVVEGWRARPYSRELIAERYVRPGFCRGVTSGGRLEGLAICRTDILAGRAMVRLVCVDAVEDGIANLLFDDVVTAARRAAAGARAVEIEWMLPANDTLKGWAAARGLKSWEQEDDFLVYGMPLDALRSRAGA